MKNIHRVALVVALLAASLCAFVLAGCSVSTSAGYTFDGGEVTVEGKTLTVQLEGNPTTGYEWTADVQGDGVSLDKSEYTVNLDASNATGMSGKYGFTYTGEKAGESTIKFTYARSWEQTADDMSVEVKVTTDSNGNITKTETVKDGKTVGSSSKQ